MKLVERLTEERLTQTLLKRGKGNQFSPVAPKRHSIAGRGLFFPQVHFP